MNYVRTFVDTRSKSSTSLNPDVFLGVRIAVPTYVISRSAPVGNRTASRSRTISTGVIHSVRSALGRVENVRIKASSMARNRVS